MDAICTTVGDRQPETATTDALEDKENQASETRADSKQDVATNPAVLENEPKIPRPDTRQEAEEAIRLYNEGGGLTPLEIALCLFEKIEHAGCNSKKVSHAIKAKAKRIESALYKARTKGRLTAEAPQYDTCYLSELKDSVLSSNNAFEPDTPVKVEFMASTTGGPIDSVIVSRL